MRYFVLRIHTLVIHDYKCGLRVTLLKPLFHVVDRILPLKTIDSQIWGLPNQIRCPATSIWEGECPGIVSFREDQTNTRHKICFRTLLDSGTTPSKNAHVSQQSSKRWLTQPEVRTSPLPAESIPPLAAIAQTNLASVPSETKFRKLCTVLEDFERDLAIRYDSHCVATILRKVGHETHLTACHTVVLNPASAACLLRQDFRRASFVIRTELCQPSLANTRTLFRKTGLCPRCGRRTFASRPQRDER